MSAACRLMVVDGLHTGAELLIADGLYLIGSELGCDMVFLDAGIEKHHLRLHVEGSKLRIERLGDAKIVVHGASVEGREVTVLQGEVIWLGNAAFSIVGAGVAEETPVRQSEDVKYDGNPVPMTVAPQIAAMPPPHASGAVWPYFVAFSLVVIGIGTFVWSRGLDISVPSMASASALEAIVPGVSAPLKAVDYIPRVREFIGDDTLDIRLEGGRIAVSGKTSKLFVKNQLQRIKKEFYGSVEIVDEVSYVLSNTEKNIPMSERITDISSGGSVRWFRTSEGTRYFEGSQMTDGAEVARIGINKIIFRRNGKLTDFRISERGKSDERIGSK